MQIKLNYVIKFVDDMDRAVKFYRDNMGLRLKNQSSGWSEFETGETILALHPASDRNPAGTTQLGFGASAIDDFCHNLSSQGIRFTQPPEPLHGIKRAGFVDSEGS